MQKKFLAIILLGLAISIAVGFKLYKRHAIVSTDAVSESITPEPESTPMPNPIRETGIRSDSTRLERLEKNQKELAERLSLVAGLLNENTYIFANGYPVDGVIYISDKWTINKMPAYLSGAGALERFLAR